MGIAFLTFEDIEHANKAVETMKGLEVDGRKINVEIATPQGNRSSSPRGRGRGGYFRGSRGSRFSRGGHRNSRPRGPVSETVVYVGNLPFAVTDEDLKKYFADCQIENAHVVHYKNGKSKGFGFVTFASFEQQQLALKQNIQVDQRKLSLRAAYSEEPHMSSTETAIEETH